MSDHDPTEAEIRAMLALSYTAKGVDMALHGRRPSLHGLRAIDLMHTPEGRREVLGWARSLAEGTFS